MKRGVILQSYGPVDSLQYTTSKTIPHFTELLVGGQVNVQIKACAISHLDIQARKGVYAFLNSGANDAIVDDMVLGYEIAGVVHGVGPEVNGFKKGDHVAGLLPLDHHTSSKHCGGGYSDYTTVDAHFLVKIPDEMPFEKAASCILSGIRAYTCLFDHCRNLERGSSIFIQSGAHVMQSFTVQLALSLNFHVWTTVNSDMEFNAISDYNSETSDSGPSLRVIDLRIVEDVCQYIIQETGGMGVDAVLLDGSDHNPTDRVVPLDDYISMLGINGTLIIPHCPFTADESEVPVPVVSDLTQSMYKKLFLKNSKVSFLFEQSYTLSCAQQGKYLHILNEIINDVNTERIDIKIVYSYPLEKVREAHRRIEQQSYLSVGKIVIKL